MDRSQPPLALGDMHDRHVCERITVRLENVAADRRKRPVVAVRVAACWGFEIQLGLVHDSPFHGVEAGEQDRKVR